MYVLRYQKYGLMREVSIRTSKKNRRCSFCGGVIRRGDKYIRLTLGNLRVRGFKSYFVCFDCWDYIRNRLAINNK